MLHDEFVVDRQEVSDLLQRQALGCAVEEATRIHLVGISHGLLLMYPAGPTGVEHYPLVGLVPRPVDECVVMSCNVVRLHIIASVTGCYSPVVLLLRDAKSVSLNLLDEGNSSSEGHEVVGRLAHHEAGVAEHGNEVHVGMQAGGVRLDHDVDQQREQLVCADRLPSVGLLNGLVEHLEALDEGNELSQWCPLCIDRAEELAGGLQEHWLVVGEADLQMCRSDKLEASDLLQELPVLLDHRSAGRKAMGMECAHNVVLQQVQHQQPLVALILLAQRAGNGTERYLRNCPLQQPVQQLRHSCTQLSG
mmetsp:Transcript_4551/g.15998  ORF Transcript_4551/g.15998 Transcript_4551/m.15998 type:complete len:306 (-) Transcript_4551:428-1345(-)